MFCDVGPDGTATNHTVHFDRANRPVLIADDAGLVAWKATCTACGKAAVDPVSAIACNLRAPGRYFDEETGLHYNLHRYYDPETGRYTRQDPIGLAGGMNLYDYGDGDPVSAVDALGLDGSCSANYGENEKSEEKKDADEEAILDVMGEYKRRKFGSDDFDYGYHNYQQENINVHEADEERFWYQKHITDHLNDTQKAVNGLLDSTADFFNHNITSDLFLAGYKTVSDVGFGMLNAPFGLGEEIGKFAYDPSLETIPGLGQLGRSIAPKRYFTHGPSHGAPHPPRAWNDKR